MRQYCSRSRRGCGRLAPLALQPVERRRDDQDHQRDLEEQIGDGQPPKGQEVEAETAQVNAKLRAQKHRDETDRPSVAMKAKASGTPAKFEATPEKVSIGERIQRGRPPSNRRSHRKADQAAEQRRGELMRIEIQ
jgi:hypothetical protein